MATEPERWILLLFVLLTLALKSAAAQPTPNQLQSNTRAVIADAMSYCNSLMMSSSLAPLRTKTRLDSADPITFEMLANSQLATAEEKSAIREWAKRGIQCHDELKRAFQRTNAGRERIQVLTATSEIFIALKAQVHNGQITWGKFNEERQRINREYQAAILSISRSENERTAQALQSFYQQQMYFQQQQLLYQQALPRSIICQQLWSFTYCSY